MTLLKINIDNRAYTSWTVFNASTMQQVLIPDFNPVEHKLLTNDVFTYNNDRGQNKLEIVHSSGRLMESIPAVLVLQNNKTYGRKGGKLLYKCVPDDMRLPVFLVPYEIKHVGFSKVFPNMYVTIRFNEWTDKHPHATLSQNIGQVDVLDNYYEYQLYCKSLNASIQKFTRDTSKALQKNSHDYFIENICKSHPEIQDRTDQKEWRIFTIDPPKSCDFDDAFSIRSLENGNKLVSVYISNVTVWIDVLKLWDSFSRRISTIYLPDRKRPMLPTILSDCLCSLQSNHTRIAFVMDIIVDPVQEEILDISYSNCLIRVFKNFVYEEPDLLKNHEYNHLMESMKPLTKKYRYISNVRNSHELVCYMMILMNYHCAKDMMKHGNGIFRSTLIGKPGSSVPENLPEDVEKFIKIWNSSSGKYIDLRDAEQFGEVRHELLELDSYIHITSPIRRLVDLLNIIRFQQNNNMLSLSTNACEFYEKWTKDLDYINMTMRAIRKVQCTCSLLEMCTNNPEIIEKEYDGFAFDKLARNDFLFQFIVYLPELKLVSRITMRDNLENFERRKFKLYVFNDEDNFKKKIRLQVVG